MEARKGKSQGLGDTDSLQRPKQVTEAGWQFLPYLSHQSCQAQGHRTGVSTVQILVRHWEGLPKIEISKIIQLPGWKEEKSVTETGNWVGTSSIVPHRCFPSHFQ